MKSGKTAERGFLMFFVQQIKDAAGDKDKEADLISEAAKHITVTGTGPAEYMEFCQRLFEEN